MRVVSVLPAVALALGMAVPASAAPINGSLQITGSVAISITNMDWRPPVDGGYGTFVTVTPATGYFATGHPGGIVSPNPLAPFGGNSLDLTLGPSGGGYTHVDIGPTNVPNFLNTFTAPGYGSLFFDLTRVVAPSAPLCTGAEVANDVCSVTAFTITVNPDGKSLTVAMSVEGFFEDPTIANSRAFYSGRYTTQVGLTTQQIEDILTKNLQDPSCVAGDTGNICASYSANFNAITGVPEPATMLTFGAGTALMAYRRRRAAAKNAAK